jgi:putative ABC transport system permease protein
VTASLSDQGLEFAIPWSQLVALLIVALVLGVLAAVAPARRAARLDVLQSIAYE